MFGDLRRTTPADVFLQPTTGEGNFLNAMQLLNHHVVRKDTWGFGDREKD
jgi:hypothetical protein